MKLAVVITTVNPPSKTVHELAARGAERIFVIGDTKTPNNWEAPGADFYPIGGQGNLGLKLASHLRAAHYARKNVGYLMAMRADAECIYDTDDDNVPSYGWARRELSCRARRSAEVGWRNVYHYFNNGDIWPRGFALAHLIDAPPALDDETLDEFPIQQGLADGEPDVDAIWRLAACPSWMRNRPFLFRDTKSVSLSKGTWCPFNSQTTWWFREAQPLLYLPSYATFRMTDIWRSFVAQRCLWELGRGIVFHSPSEVMQRRNDHDLMKDFEDEVPGYLANESIAETLGKLQLWSGVGSITRNLVVCYEALVSRGFLPADELACVHAWVDDVERIAA